MPNKMKEPDLVIGCVTENLPKYLAQTLRLIQSIRWFGGGVSESKFIVCAVEDIDRLWADEFRHYGAEVRIVKRYSKLHPPSNKLRFLQQLDVAEYEHVVLLDCDTIVVRDPSKSFLADGFHAKLADVATVPHQKFEKLFSAFNIPIPSCEHVTTVTGEPTIPYFNAGVLIFSREEMRGLVPTWLQLNKTLTENLHLLSGCSNFCEQASLSLALSLNGITFNCLGNNMNFPTHFEGSFVNLENIAPIIIHYHWKTDRLGRIENSGYPLVDERIAAFNKRLNDSRLFSDLRRPVFVVGPMRSGTTLLADQIGCSKQIAHCPFELKDIWSRDGGVPTASAKTRDHLCPELGAKDVHLGQSERLRIAFLKKIEDTFGEVDPNRYFLNKNPHLCNKLPFVEALFPDARYVWIFRDMPFVVASLKALFGDVYQRQTTWHYWPEPHGNTKARCWEAFHQESKPDGVDSKRLFPGGDVAYLAEYWLESNNAINDFFKSTISNCLKINYSDLVNNFDETIKECLSFIGIPNEDQILPDGSNIKEDRNNLWTSRISASEASTLREFVNFHKQTIDAFGLTLDISNTYIQTFDNNYKEQYKGMLPINSDNSQVDVSAPNAVKSKAICILGMHRSGTSTISRAINLLGAFLGENVDLIPATQDNQEGYWERIDINNLHERLLAQMKRQWDTAAPLPDQWQLSEQIEPFREELSSLIRKNFLKHTLWAWKDPRTCILFPLWKSILDEMGVELTCVFAVRNPVDVANSLRKRDGLPLDKSFGTWFNHNIHALQASIGIPTAFLSYDNFLENWEHELRNCANVIHIPWPTDDTLLKQSMSSFIRPNLRHSKSTTNDLSLAPFPVKELYLRLTDMTNSCKVPDIDLTNTLKRLAEDFYNYSSFFQHDLSNLLDKELELSECKQIIYSNNQTVAELNSEKNSLDLQLIDRQRELDCKTRQSEELLHELTELRQVLANNAQQIEKTAQQLEISGQQLAERVLQIDGRDRVIADLERRLRDMYHSLSWKITAPLRGLYDALHLGPKPQDGHNFSPSSPVQIPNHVETFSAGHIPGKILTFDICAAPLVSIVIPVFNQFEHTYSCLASILANTFLTQYEVIIADDASQDETKDISEYVKNVLHIRNADNLGFLLNCNSAASSARGKYILFLNNDTNVQKNWLKHLTDLMEADTTIGMTGSKLVYPDGRLQEAGGIIWNDANGQNYGRLDDPSKPEYNYVKDVDYISGASIMIRKELWEQAGGFDERFAPAYYEDTDLAFTVRKLGYRVVFQPKSVVVHFEGISHGTDLGSGIKSYQVRNKELFLDKWRDVLSRDHFGVDENLFLAKDRSRDKKTVLFIDYQVPLVDMFAGSRTNYMYLRLLVQMGLNVKFIGADFLRIEPYSSELNRLGIKTLDGAWYRANWKQWIMENAVHLDYVLFNKPDPTCMFLDFIKAHTNVKVLYQGHDLHYLRLKRKYEVEGGKEVLAESTKYERIEKDIFAKSDAILTFSSFEHEVISELVPDKLVATVPLYFYDDFAPIDNDFTKRKNLLFVGGFGHTPNVDAVTWFSRDVLPIILKQIPDLVLHVIGANPPQEITSLESDHIRILGFVSDETLAQYYRTSRMVVVPLRFGAGVKGKTIEALYHGLPIVSTGVGIEGIPDIGSIVTASDTPEEFAAQVIALYGDSLGLLEASSRNNEFVKNRYSTEAARETMENLLARLD